MTDGGCPCEMYCEDTDAPENETCECGHGYDDHNPRTGCLATWAMP